MGGTSKNDLKTLFFICNSVHAVIALFMFSSGVGNRVLKSNETIDTVFIVLGLLYIVVVLLAYVAASAESQKLLRGYTLVMIIQSIYYVTCLARWDGYDPNDLAAYKELYAGMIGGTIVTMVSVLLSFSLAVQQSLSAEVTAPVGSKA